VFGCAAVSKEPNCRYQQPEAAALGRGRYFDRVAYVPRIRRRRWIGIASDEMRDAGVSAKDDLRQDQGPKSGYSCLATAPQKAIFAIALANVMLLISPEAMCRRRSGASSAKPNNSRRVDGMKL